MERKIINEIKIISWLMLIMEVIVFINFIPFVLAAYSYEKSIIGLILFWLFPLILSTLIIANIGIIKLKEPLRKLFIYVALLGIITFFLYSLNNAIITKESFFSAIYYWSFFGFIPYRLYTVILVALLFAIYYFTRPRTKEQFTYRKYENRR